jgi:hypothetical protein
MECTPRVLFEYGMAGRSALGSLAGAGKAERNGLAALRKWKVRPSTTLLIENS